MFLCQGLHILVCLFSFFRSDGSFVINGVASGSYVVEVSNPDYIFEASRVDITAKGIQVTLHSRELSGKVLDSQPRGRGFEPHWLHCVMSLSKNINPSLVLVQPRKTCSFIMKDC